MKKNKEEKAWQGGNFKPPFRSEYPGLGEPEAATALSVGLYYEELEGSIH